MYFLFQLRVQRNDMTVHDHINDKAMQAGIYNGKRNMKNVIRFNAKSVLNVKIQESRIDHS